MTLYESTACQGTQTLVYDVLQIAMIITNCDSTTSFFVVGMIYSLFYRHNSSCTVFWVSSFHLSVNIVVLHQLYLSLNKQ